jgi:hypothetical protein
VRRSRRPGLLGALDLDDLTPAHELGDRLTRQANGVVPRRSFHSTRTAVSVSMKVYYMVRTPLEASAVDWKTRAPLPLCRLRCEPVCMRHASNDRPRYQAQMGGQPVPVGMQRRGQGW